MDKITPLRLRPMPVDPLADVTLVLSDALLAPWPRTMPTIEDASRLLRVMSSHGWSLVRTEDLLPDTALDALPLHGVEVIVLRADELDQAQARAMLEELTVRAGRPIALVCVRKGASLEALDVEQMRRAGWVRTDG